MNEDTLIAPDDFGMTFSGPEFALILSGAVLIRLIPVLILISALVKMRRFPQYRALHITVLCSVALIALLGAFDTLVPSAVPTALRTSGVWAFLWIFAAALLCVSWTRSATRTRLRPRALDIPTLIAAGALLLAMAIPLGVNW